MSAQTTYRHATPRGVAGSLYDLSPYSIDTRLNGEMKAGQLKFGMGVIQGDSPGTNVVRPASDSTAAIFDGVVLTGFNTQQNMAGTTVIMPLDTVGVLRYGKAWVRIVEDVTPKYADPLYLIIDGEDAGLFTNESDSNTIAIKGRFISAKGTGDIAPIELYNQSQE